jgi:hypothetical protein
MMDEPWKTVITLTGPDISVETENIAWGSIPKALIEAYRSCTRSLIENDMDDPAERALHTEILEAMERIIQRYERHTTS